jgi:peptide/nickel transport system permease protein
VSVATSILSQSRRRRYATFARTFRRNRKAVFGLGVVGALLVVSVLAPALAPYSAEATEPADRNAAPSADHPFGTDQLGRDIFSRVVVGTRVSLAVGASAVLLALVGGVPIGLVAGYYQGLVDEAFMRVMDAFMAFPPVLLALVIMAVVGPALSNVVYAVALVYTPYFARVTRSAAITVSNEPYVDAAVARGETDASVMLREVLPNCAAPILVQASINVAFAMLVEASLSFLGLGAQPPTPSWGLMINEGRPFLQDAPWLVFFPGAAIATAVIGFNLLGDGLRDVLDPKVDTVE